MIVSTLDIVLRQLYIALADLLSRLRKKKSEKVKTKKKSIFCWNSLGYHLPFNTLLSKLLQKKQETLSVEGKFKEVFFYFKRNNNSSFLPVDSIGGTTESNN